MKSEHLFEVAPMSRTPLRDDGVAGDIDLVKDKKRTPSRGSQAPFVVDPLTEAKPTLVELVEAVRQLEYGRPSGRSVEAMIRERRGTCSAKHLFLARRFGSLIPSSRPRIIHRVYRIERKRAIELFGKQAAEAVPPEGLVDVHRYLTAVIDGRRLVIDATFPGPAWDGASDMPLSCGPGQDYPSVGDPDEEKHRLEVEHCDLELRERFISSLASKPS